MVKGRIKKDSLVELNLIQNSLVQIDYIEFSIIFPITLSYPSRTGLQCLFDLCLDHDGIPIHGLYDIWNITYHRKAVNRMCFTNTNEDMTGVEIPIDIPI